MVTGIFVGILILAVNYLVSEKVSKKIVQKTKGFQKSLTIVFIDFFIRFFFLVTSFFIVSKVMADELKTVLVTFVIGVTFFLFYRIVSELK